MRHNLAKMRSKMRHRRIWPKCAQKCATENFLLHFYASIFFREWASGILVEYESLRVSNGRVKSGRVGSKIVKLRVDMRVHTEKFQFFNVKYHAIIEIVECESGRVAKKWSSASRLCEYAGTRPFPTLC